MSVRYDTIWGYLIILFKRLYAVLLHVVTLYMSCDWRVELGHVFPTLQVTKLVIPRDSELSRNMKLKEDLALQLKSQKVSLTLDLC